MEWYHSTGNNGEKNSKWWTWLRQKAELSCSVRELYLPLYFLFLNDPLSVQKGMWDPVRWRNEAQPGAGKRGEFEPHVEKKPGVWWGTTRARAVSVLYTLLGHWWAAGTCFAGASCASVVAKLKNYVSELCSKIRNSHKWEDLRSLLFTTHMLNSPAFTKRSVWDVFNFKLK